MAGVNYWSSYEPGSKVSECVWGGEQESSSEDGGGGVTWETQAMEVKGQLISAPDPLTCLDRKQRERMAELQERRRSLQALLSTRLAELRRICLQEAELTGAVPSDFPLEVGEKLPCVQRRGGTSRQTNRKCRAEEEDSQRSKPKKTLFSGALRKHSDSEHNTHTQTHTHHGKRTVHRGCHTDDTVRSESSSTSDSIGHDNDDAVSQCRPPLVSAGSPVEVFYKTRRNSVHTSVAEEGGDRGNATCHSNSSDGLLDRSAVEEDGQQGGLWVNGVPGSRGMNGAGVFRNAETPADARTRTNNGLSDVGGAGRGRGPGRGGGYSEVLLDYVWGKQQQLQRQQSQPGNRQPITAHHQLLLNGHVSQQPPAAPSNYHALPGDQRRVKVTRTKSCGPFLPVQQSPTDTHNPPLSAIQPDPHPHLLPPRPPQLPPTQDAQLEDATRSLHKALALEGLRDWYLRNTIGSPSNTGINTKVNGGGQRSDWRGRSSTRPTEDSWCHPAADLSDGDKSSYRVRITNRRYHTIHVPWTSAARQVFGQLAFPASETGSSSQRCDPDQPSSPGTLV
ncbi:Coiled-coil domain-containing protein 120 [Larimichthys crocea]|uniref:Coiled-coil domain-containing protein 120 n=1 Tax=Larimichthys crocea TaxID=215358 RepID=A0A6G0IMH6_LARCR|nr:Coiled-coil domain-containing protein 120 [Larimichthys crocea]